MRDGVLLADALATSVEEHARFGGVVPEVAARAHVEAMVPTVHRALAAAGIRASEIDAVAVTEGPGLAGPLMVGVSAAKAYAFGLGVPLYGVHHLAAHVAVDALESGPVPESIALLVSGGHSSLLAVGDLARTRTPSWARRSTMLRARRTTRSLGCSAFRSRAGRPSTRLPVREPSPSASRAARRTTARSTSPSPG